MLKDLATRPLIFLKYNIMEHNKTTINSTLKDLLCIDIRIEP